MASQGRKLDPPQAISALAGVRPPDLQTLRGDPAMEAKYLLLSWERDGKELHTHALSLMWDSLWDNIKIFGTFSMRLILFMSFCGRYDQFDDVPCNDTTIVYQNLKVDLYQISYIIPSCGNGLPL